MAKSAILMHSSGEVIWEKDADIVLEPASVTKIMTMLLIFEGIQNELITLDDQVTVSEYAASMGGSQVYLKAGEVMPVHDMIKAVAVASGNDAAVALSEHLYGTESTFVEKMNERAKELGMTNTHFVNVNGLPAEGHLTTARDIGIMSAELLKHKEVLEFTKIWIDSLRGGEFQLVNTNKMINTYNGMTGLKTGFTESAGYCLSASASRDNLDIIAVVMKNSSVKERTADASALLNYGFANYTTYDAVQKVEIPMCKVTLGEQESVELELSNKEPILIKRIDEKQITYKINMADSVKAPVTKGQSIGTVTFFAGDTELCERELVAKEAVSRLTIKEIFTWLFKTAAMRK